MCPDGDLHHNSLSLVSDRRANSVSRSEIGAILRSCVGKLVGTGQSGVRYRHPNPREGVPDAGPRYVAPLYWSTEFVWSFRADNRLQSRML